MRRRWWVVAMALPLPQPLLPPLLSLPLLPLLLQLGPGADRPVFIASTALWGSVTSQPRCDLTAWLSLCGDRPQGALGEPLEHSQGSCPLWEGSTSRRAALSKGWDTGQAGAEPTTLLCFLGTVTGAARSSQSPRTTRNHSQGLSDLLGGC